MRGPGPAASCGRRSGIVTRRSTYPREAPIAAAAPSSRGSIERSPASAARITSGIETNVVATIAPQIVNVSWMPAASSHRPTTPLRPSAVRSATPPTTGGRTRGRITTARSTDRPGIDERASTQATGVPSTSESAAAASETSSDRRSAVHAPGRGELVDQVRPRRADQQRRDRDHDERDADRREDADRQRRPPPPGKSASDGAYDDGGGRKPNSASVGLTLRPGHVVDERLCDLRVAGSGYHGDRVGRDDVDVVGDRHRVHLRSDRARDV